MCSCWRLGPARPPVASSTRHKARGCAALKNFVRAGPSGALPEHRSEDRWLRVSTAPGPPGQRAASGRPAPAVLSARLPGRRAPLQAAPLLLSTRGGGAGAQGRSYRPHPPPLQSSLPGLYLLCWPGGEIVAQGARGRDGIVAAGRGPETRGLRPGPRAGDRQGPPQGDDQGAKVFQPRPRHLPAYADNPPPGNCHQLARRA